MRQTEQFFAEHPVFTLEQFASIVGRNVSTDISYRHLAYFARAGRVKRIRNALYAVVPPGVAAKVYTPDPYLVAATAGQGAPLGYHTALELLGVAHSMFRTKTVVSRRAFPCESARLWPPACVPVDHDLAGPCWSSPRRRSPTFPCATAISRPAPRISRR
jgi:predicted transcriptional regulator of viral defense system